MTDDKKELNPNATIQLDAASAADVVLESSPQLPSGPEKSEGGSVRRVTPPPLPPSVSQPPSMSSRPSATSLPPPNKNRNLIYGVAFVVLLALVIGLGVKVGGSLRPAVPPPVASASVAPVATPVATTNQTPNQTPTQTPTQTIVIHTIEMNDQPDGG